MNDQQNDQQQLAAVIQNWGFWRDQGRWEQLATTFHPEGTIQVTWFSGRFADFIAASREMRKTRRGSKHEIGGSRIEVRGERAIAETNVHIMGRRELHGIECDLTAWGRFFDFFEKREGWAIVRRVAIYEKDRVDPVMPGATVSFDEKLLASMPAAYRFLGYSLASGGFSVSQDLPVDDSPALDQLHGDAEVWLRG